MEKNPNCKAHGEPIEMYCDDCKSLLCKKCLLNHEKKKCKHPIKLSDYAEKELLPRYDTQIKDFEEKKESVEESIKEFMEVTNPMKAELLELKGKLKKLLDRIDISLVILSLSENEPLINSIKEIMTKDQEELKDAVKTSNISCIIQKLNTDNTSIIFADGEKCLINTMSKSITHLLKQKELDLLGDSLDEFNYRYQMLSGKHSNTVDNKFIYGLCSTQKDRTLLCQYDIAGRKLRPFMSVPQDCSISQTGRRVFVSGGRVSKNPMDTLSELEQNKQLLTARAPMNFAKYFHAVEAVSNKEFVTVGGYEHMNAIAYCEEYSIDENKWKSLPSLNIIRYYAATAFLDNKYLYAIGGYRSDNTIEMLDMNERKAWVRVHIVSSDVKFDVTPMAFPLFKTQIMILCGGDSTEVGIFYTTLDMVKKHSTTIMSDRYLNNMAAIVNGSAYVIGYNGHVHIYDMSKQSFTELGYSIICT